MSSPTSDTELDEEVSGNYLLRNIGAGVRMILDDTAMLFYVLFLLVIVVMGIFGPMIAPYGIDETLYDEDDRILRTAPPSVEHPLGTTSRGNDVLSRLIFGAQPTVITGLVGGTMIASIGTVLGLISGYTGGYVDDVIMRFTDIVYSIPVIPFAIVMSVLLGTGFLTSILIIGMLLWRSTARIVRAQTLQIKERPFILSAKAKGASSPRIIVRHILPNVLPMVILYFAIGIGITIVFQAGLSFVGVVSPFVPSWGIMVRNAFNSGLMTQAWWWSIPPGLLISFTVAATYLLGRKYEARATQEAGGTAIVQGGG